MTESVSDLAELVARQRIWDCMLRYARGMDRLDAALALSAYHPGAIEDHGAMIAPCEQFVPQVIAFHKTSELVTQHILSNHSCEIDGDTAHAETYAQCFSKLPSGENRLSFGRFIDRLEKRGGAWGIVSRVSIPEGSIEAPAFDDRVGMTNLPGSLSKSARDNSDPSYVRPLPLTRAQS